MSFVVAKTFTPKTRNNYSRKTVKAVLDFRCCNKSYGDHARFERLDLGVPGPTSKCGGPPTFLAEEMPRVDYP